MHSILLIEDDPEIIKLLKLHFDQNLYAFFSATTIHEATKQVFKNKFDVIILDITLPDGDGINFCKNIRNDQITTPVLILTCNSDERDKVLALELGADDYVMKPFGIMELIARVKALIRRSQNSHGSDKLNQKTVKYKELFIDHEKKKAVLFGKRLDLTVKEFDILWLLANNPGKNILEKGSVGKRVGCCFRGIRTYNYLSY